MEIYLSIFLTRTCAGARPRAGAKTLLRITGGAGASRGPAGGAGASWGPGAGGWGGFPGQAKLLFYSRGEGWSTAPAACWTARTAARSPARPLMTMIVCFIKNLQKGRLQILTYFRDKRQSINRWPSAAAPSAAAPATATPTPESSIDQDNDGQNETTQYQGSHLRNWRTKTRNSTNIKSCLIHVLQHHLKLSCGDLGLSTRSHRK